jgi:hypothetical protein
MSVAGLPVWMDLVFRSKARADAALVFQGKDSARGEQPAFDALKQRIQSAKPGEVLLVTYNRQYSIFTRSDFIEALQPLVKSSDGIVRFVDWNALLSKDRTKIMERAPLVYVAMTSENRVEVSLDGAPMGDPDRSLAKFAEWLDHGNEYNVIVLAAAEKPGAKEAKQTLEVRDRLCELVRKKGRHVVETTGIPSQPTPIKPVKHDASDLFKTFNR